MIPLRIKPTIVQMMRFFFLILISLGLTGCGDDYSIKPIGQLRLEYPESKYKNSDFPCPYSFEYSSFSIRKETENPVQIGEEGLQCDLSQVGLDCLLQVAGCNQAPDRYAGDRFFLQQPAMLGVDVILIILGADQIPLAQQRLDVLRNTVGGFVSEEIGDLAIGRPDSLIGLVVNDVGQKFFLLSRELRVIHYVRVRFMYNICAIKQELPVMTTL